MRHGIRSVTRICSRRWIAGLALVLLLAGCTGSGDPAGTPEPSQEGQAPIPEPTRASVEPEPGLYQIDPATGKTELILSGAGEPREPERSPDGSRLVFQAMTRNGTVQIFVLEDGVSRRLTHLSGGAAEPAWSPDGSQIAFAGAASRGRDSDIFVMEADGGHIRLLARTARYDRRPDWSPDGSRIVFDTYGEIWVASVDGGQVAQIPVSTPDGRPAAPIWSPNGRWIAFTSYDASTINGIVHITRLWVVRPDGTDMRPLDARKPAFWDWQLEPSWSPDGRSIAFVGGEGRTALRGVMDIGVIDVQTGEVVYRRTSLRVWDVSWDAEGLITAGVMGNARPSLSPPILGVVSVGSSDPWPGVG